MSEHKITFSVADEKLVAWTDHLEAVQSVLGFSNLEVTPIVEGSIEEPRYFEHTYLSSFINEDGEAQGLKAHTLAALARNVRRTREGGYGALPDIEDGAEPFISLWDTQRKFDVESLHSSYLEFAARNYDRIRQLGQESAKDIRVFLTAHGLWQD